MKIWGKRKLSRVPGSQWGWGCWFVRLRVQRLLPNARNRRLGHGAVGGLVEKIPRVLHFLPTISGREFWPPIQVCLTPRPPRAQPGGIAGGLPSNCKVLASLEMGIPTILGIEGPATLAIKVLAILEIAVPAI